MYSLTQKHPVSPAAILGITGNMTAFTCLFVCELANSPEYIPCITVVLCASEMYGGLRSTSGCDSATVSCDLVQLEYHIRRPVGFIGVLHPHVGNELSLVEFIDSMGWISSCV